MSVANIRQLGLIVALIVTLMGCASRPVHQVSPAVTSSLATDAEPANPIGTGGTDSADVISLAHSLEGIRYRYGGVSPRSGFDCSGFMYYIHSQIGVELPRTSVAQYRHTQPISRQSLKPGDLVFFHTRRGRINHVGLYLGDNRFIHAPGKGKAVSVTSLDHPYWQPRFARGGRI